MVMNKWMVNHIAMRATEYEASLPEGNNTIEYNFRLDERPLPSRFPRPRHPV